MRSADRIVRPTLASRSLPIGDRNATELVARYGSPLFVLDARAIRASCARLRAAFQHPRIRLFYAMKANPNLRVLELLGEEGIGIDCCSPGEVHLAGRAGFEPGRITFTGTALTLEDAGRVGSGAAWWNLDALSQVDRLLDHLPGRATGIRINPGFGAGSHRSNTTGGEDSKLGIPIQRAAEAREIARRRGGRIRGLHVHTGSGGLDPQHFIRVARLMFELAGDFGDELEYIDLGGGIGIPPRREDPAFDLELYAGEVRLLLDAWNRRHPHPIEVFIEPGQLLVSRAGWLLMTVIVRKETPSGRTVAILDSSFNHYLGTALYQSHHDFILAGDLDRPIDGPVQICGHLCNTGDTFAIDHPMPRLEEGDLVGMADAGAYGMSRGSNYNSRPLPAEVMVDGSEAMLIRRRQTYEDLLACQV